MLRFSWVRFAPSRPATSRNPARVTAWPATAATGPWRPGPSTPTWPSSWPGGRLLPARQRGQGARADVAREAAIVEHLAGRGLPVPRPLRARSGEAWLAVARALRLAVPLGDRAGADPGARSSPCTPTRPGPPWPACTRSAPTSPTRGRAATSPTRSPAASPPSRPTPPATPSWPPPSPSWARRWPAWQTSRARELPLGLIHGDLFIDNVLFHDGSLTALLDFEQASWGRLAYDLAVSVLAFGFGGDDFRPEITRAFLAGVRRHPPAVAPGAGGLRRRAALRRLPLRRHPHHRRVPAPRRGRAAGQGLPPLPAAPARPRAAVRRGRAVRRCPERGVRPCAPWRCTCGASPCARCRGRRSGCPCPSGARG